MKKSYLLLVLCLIALFGLQAQEFSYPDMFGKKAGMTLLDSKSTGVSVEFAVPGFTMEDLSVKGTMMKSINLPGTFLFNDEGMPNLPGKGGFIAIPQGSTPKLRIVSQKTDIIHNVEIAPAPRIPLDNDRNPLEYTPNQAVYSKNAMYPASPVILSEITQIRGVDVVTIGITPFQYNPVTKDLVVYKELIVDVAFEGGNDVFGNTAYRNRWWDPILQDNIMNYNVLPKVDYDARLRAFNDNPMEDECEYIIITPTSPEHLAWADSIRKFRMEQGILTKVFTVDEIGGNTTTAIEAFIDNAYLAWTLKPAACLMFGDYGNDGTKQLISPLLPHSGGYPNFASDNKYADVTNDQLPDVVFSRITASDPTQLEIMCTKFLNHERNPPVDPHFYDKPITALGWQTERWFQLCSEIVGGFFREQYGKHPRRINAIYQGTPGSSWSSATNTSTIVSYFGPSGLGYIPQQPSSMPCCWNGGTATQINQGIDSGAFMLMHRDHGAYTEWGEPAYNTSWAMQLNNTNLTYIFSINCQTGAYHRSSDCLGEKFHRQYKNGHNAGSLGFVAPTETSYSFVNDTFVWGMMDNMWPDFMPAEYTNPESRGLMPAFGHAAGKYFLQRSNWPYNTSNKVITYQMFHMHGDAFTTLYSEVPLELDITHAPTINFGSTTFQITATDSAFIALTCNNEIISTGYGSASGPVSFTIPILPVGSQIKITATKRNYFRYNDYVTVTSEALMANFTASQSSICENGSVDFNDLSSGNPTSWSWEFPGGNPATSNVQNPTGITYAQPGSYDVKLTISKATGNPATITKTAFIQVISHPTANFESIIGCPGIPVDFTDMSNANGGTLTGWAWNFGDPSSGANNTSILQNPAHTFNSAGNYAVTLEVTANGLCKDSKTIDIVMEDMPGVAAKPTGPATFCNHVTDLTYTTAGATNAISYEWMVEPETAGAISSNEATGTLLLTDGFTGDLSIKVKAIGLCGSGDYSEVFPVVVTAKPAVPSKPEGADSVNLNKGQQSDFTIAQVPTATSYLWTLEPATAGTLNGSGITVTANWTPTYRGMATLNVKAMNDCGESVASENKEVKLYAPVGMAENEGARLEITPNPNNGRFSLDINANISTTLTLSVINNLGVVVYQEKDVKIDGKLHKNLDLTHLAKGVYLLKAEGKGVQTSTSVVIGK